jgi:hypothetical protein
VDLISCKENSLLRRMRVGLEAVQLVVLPSPLPMTLHHTPVYCCLARCFNWQVIEVLGNLIDPVLWEVRVQLSKEKTVTSIGVFVVS